jgi:hypothetical protein
MEPNQPSGPEPYRHSPEPGGPDRPAGGPGYGYQSAPPFGSPPGQQPAAPHGSYYGPPPGQQPSGSPGSYYGPPPGEQFEPPPSGAAAGPRARTGLVLVVAVITEIVFIAVFDNQWISAKIARFEFRTSNSFLAQVASSALTYSWRFTPRTGDTQHLWLSQMMLILTVLVLSALLIASVVRGRVTFGRAFFGTWMSVIVATELATVVRGLIIGDAFNRPGTSRLTNAVFGALGPTAQAFVAGVGLGVVTALVVAVVAAATRRTPPAADHGGPRARRTCRIGTGGRVGPASCRARGAGPAPSARTAPAILRRAAARSGQRPRRSAGPDRTRPRRGSRRATRRGARAVQRWVGRQPA